MVAAQSFHLRGPHTKAHTHTRRDNVLGRRLTPPLLHTHAHTLFWMVVVLYLLPPHPAPPGSYFAFAFACGCGAIVHTLLIFDIAITLCNAVSPLRLLLCGSCVTLLYGGFDIDICGHITYVVAHTRSTYRTPHEHRHSRRV